MDNTNIETQAQETLKRIMSEPYCDATRFDYLDEEEIALIVSAMIEFSKLNKS